MSGECEKCGEHALECFCRKQFPKPNEAFFYSGRFFEKEEDFWAYVSEFSTRQTTVDDFDRLFDALKRDVWMNLSLKKVQMNNAQLRIILEESFFEILKKFFKLQSKENL